MELKELIEYSLNQLTEVKKFEAKKNYLVEELVLELNVTTTVEGNGKIQFKIFSSGAELGGNTTNEKVHKITLKLKPKKTINSNKTEAKK
ncbi:MAG: trypco2 family protein [Chitinophagales bacterium]